MKKTIIFLSPIPSYDFYLTAAYATYFQGQSAADHFHDGIYRRLLNLGDRLYLINVRSVGSVDTPSLEVTLKGKTLSERRLFEVRNQVARLLGIDQELEPFYQTALKDTALDPLVQSFRGLHIPPRPCPCGRGWFWPS